MLEYVSGRLQPWVDKDTRQFDRLVFVCLGNINRSAFAAEVARALGENCVSFGLVSSTGAPATPAAVAQAIEHRIDLAQHRATDFSDHRPAERDLLLVMEVRHAHRLVAAGVPASSIRLLGTWAAPQRLHIHDPHGCDPRYIATCFTVIESAVRRLVASRRSPVGT